MADTPNDIEQEVEAIILARFKQKERQDSPANTQHEPGSSQTGGEEGKRAIHIDKYTLPNGDTLYRLPHGEGILVPGNIAGDDPTTHNPLDENAVESVAPPTDTDPIIKTPTIPLTEEETPQEHEREPAPTVNQRQVRRSYILVPLLLLFILTASTVSYLFVLPTLASADVTIVPYSKTVHQQMTIPIAVDGRTGVQGRSLESINLARSVVVSATGHAHEEATAATGVITFYNGDVQPITIPAGVSFQVNGIAIVTTASVTVQAAVDPLKGEANVPAQVVGAGAIGNIPAHAFYTRCCGSELITVTNVTPFSGGRDARDYSFVQSSDIQNATSLLLPPLTTKVTAALTKQLESSESLIPPLCTPKTIASKNPGEEATQVHVTVVQTCKSVAYKSASLQSVATSLLIASQKLDHFEQVGTIELTVTNAGTDGRSAHISASITGTWVYTFSSPEVTRLKHIIAGKSQQQAKATLERVNGIASVSIHVQRLDFKDLLPTDPQHISLQFFSILS
jgi:hypothetical protein